MHKTERTARKIGQENKQATRFAKRSQCVVRKRRTAREMRQEKPRMRIRIERGQKAFAHC